jgi:hypothetical protein
MSPLQEQQRLVHAAANRVASVQAAAPARHGKLRRLGGNQLKHTGRGGSSEGARRCGRKPTTANRTPPTANRQPLQCVGRRGCDRAAAQASRGRREGGCSPQGGRRGGLQGRGGARAAGAGRGARPGGGVGCSYWATVGIRSCPLLMVACGKAATQHLRRGLMLPVHRNPVASWRLQSSMRFGKKRRSFV